MIRAEGRCLLHPPRPCLAVKSTNEKGSFPQISQNSGRTRPHPSMPQRCCESHTVKYVQLFVALVEGGCGVVKEKTVQTGSRTKQRQNQDQQPSPEACFLKVPVTFWARKAVLCLPCLNSRSTNFENDTTKLSVNEANLAGL